MSDQQILFPSEHRDRLKNVPYTLILLTLKFSLGYVKDGNCFAWIEGIDTAQNLC